jgi:hypothetical protein
MAKIEKKQGKEPSEGKPKEDERTEEMVKEEDKGHKFGGKVKGKAIGGRIDRRQRGGGIPHRASGGRMTPKSPLSGADVKHMPYEGTLKGIDQGGKGDKVRP